MNPGPASCVAVTFTTTPLVPAGNKVGLGVRISRFPRRQPRAVLRVEQPNRSDGREPAARAVRARSIDHDVCPGGGEHTNPVPKFYEALRLVIARFATSWPNGQLTVEAVGTVAPHGYTVRYP